MRSGLALAVSVASLTLAGCSGERTDVEEAVRHDMLDPDATQFRDVTQCSGDREVWRGEVNGKNTFGAYVGFKPFFYSAHSVAFLESYNFRSLMERCYSDLPKNDPSTAATEDPGLSTAPPLKPSPSPSKVQAGRGLTPNSDADFAMPTDEELEVERQRQRKEGKYPYVTPDGVDIRDPVDEANWKKYGSTDPNGGE